MKTCTKCGETKPLEEFYKHPAGVGGRRGDCKTCVLAARRRRYAEDGETLRARVRTYQEKYPERVAAQRAAAKARRKAGGGRGE